MVGCNDGDIYIAPTDESNPTTEPSSDINDVDENDSITQPLTPTDSQPTSSTNTQPSTSGDTYDDDISWGPLH